MATLPQGLLADRHAASAVIRRLTGREEEMLATRSDAPLAETVTALLERCVTSLGGIAPTSASIRDLTVGDREALLLQIRRETIGDRIDCVATCQHPRCGERL